MGPDSCSHDPADVFHPLARFVHFALFFGFAHFEIFAPIRFDLFDHKLLMMIEIR